MEEFNKEQAKNALVLNEEESRQVMEALDQAKTAIENARELLSRS